MIKLKEQMLSDLREGILKSIGKEVVATAKETGSGLVDGFKSLTTPKKTAKEIFQTAKQVGAYARDKAKLAQQGKLFHDPDKIKESIENIQEFVSSVEKKPTHYEINWHGTNAIPKGKYKSEYHPTHKNFSPYTMTPLGEGKITNTIAAGVLASGIAAGVSKLDARPQESIYDDKGIKHVIIKTKPTLRKTGSFEKDGKKYHVYFPRLALEVK